MWVFRLSISLLIIWIILTINPILKLGIWEITLNFYRSCPGLTFLFYIFALLQIISVIAISITPEIWLMFES